MKNTQPTTRRQMLSIGGVAAALALLASGSLQANHHLPGEGGSSGLKAKCKKLRDALKRAKRTGNRAKIRRLRKKLRACLRKLNA